MAIIRGVGIDAAFANMGFAHVEIHLPYGSQFKPHIKCLDLHLVHTEVIEDRKVVRKSSTELRRAKELCDALRHQCERFAARFAFVEVPSGSQSASAARALGVAVGVLGSCPIPIIEVSPGEVKEAVIGRAKGAFPSKADMIAWAMHKWPNAPWQLHDKTSKGRVGKGGQIVGAYRKGDPLKENEHLADALAAVVAGINTPTFKQLAALMKPEARRRITL